MNGLFGNNLFFLYIFASITIMNYSKMTENQKIIIMYLLTFGLAVLKISSVKECLMYLILVTCFYLEFLSEDTVKIKFVKKLRYKILDYLFLMFVQYKFLLFFLTLTLTSVRFQALVSRNLKLDLNISSILDYISIVFFFLTIFEVSKEKFKMKSFSDILTKDFVPPINESDLLPYNVYFQILIEMEDKTYYLREKSYNFFSIDFIHIKIKQYREQMKNEKISQKIKKYVYVSQVIRGYSTIEMQLIRTVALESGYNMKITRKIFEILYTNIIFKSMNEYYQTNHYVNNDKFKEYLLSIYVSKVRTNISGVVYSNMTKYLSKDIEDWTKEKFYIACLGLPYQEFSDYYVYGLYRNILNNLDIDEEKIRYELELVSESKKDYYGAT